MEVPTKTATLCGRTVTLRPVRLKDATRVLRVQASLEDDPSQLYILLAGALWMTPEEFEREFPDVTLVEAARLAPLIAELNNGGDGGFFPPAPAAKNE